MTLLNMLLKSLLILGVAQIGECVSQNATREFDDNSEQYLNQSLWENCDEGGKMSASTYSYEKDEWSDPVCKCFDPDGAPPGYTKDATVDKSGYRLRCITDHNDLYLSRCVSWPSDYTSYDPMQGTPTLQFTNINIQEFAMFPNSSTIEFVLETKPLQVIPTGSYDNRIFLAITKENFTSTLETKDFECVYNLDITGGETRIESGEESIGSTSKCFLFQGRQKDVFGSQTLELDFHASIIRCTKCLSEELKSVSFSTRTDSPKIKSPNAIADLTLHDPVTGDNLNESKASGDSYCEIFASVKVEYRFASAGLTQDIEKFNATGAIIDVFSGGSSVFREKESADGNLTVAQIDYSWKGEAFKLGYEYVNNTIYPPYRINQSMTDTSDILVDIINRKPSEIFIGEDNIVGTMLKKDDDPRFDADYDVLVLLADPLKSPGGAYLYEDGSMIKQLVVGDNAAEGNDLDIYIRPYKATAHSKLSTTFTKNVIKDKESEQYMLSDDYFKFMMYVAPTIGDNVCKASYCDLVIQMSICRKQDVKVCYASSKNDWCIPNSLYCPQTESRRRVLLTAGIGKVDSPGSRLEDSASFRLSWDNFGQKQVGDPSQSIGADNDAKPQTKSVHEGPLIAAGIFAGLCILLLALARTTRVRQWYFNDIGADGSKSRGSVSKVVPACQSGYLQTTGETSDERNISN